MEQASGGIEDKRKKTQVTRQRQKLPLKPLMPDKDRYTPNTGENSVVGKAAGGGQLPCYVGKIRKGRGKD